MEAIAFIDLLCFAATVFCCVIFFLNRKDIAPKPARTLLMLLILLQTFQGFSNFLEWSGITDALDNLEDYLALLEPLLWGFFIYAWLQNIAVAEREKLIQTLEDQNKELESFVYAASHDLKNPLTAIKELASILLQQNKDKLGTKSLSYIKRILINTKKMNDLITSLIKLARDGQKIGPKAKINVRKLFTASIQRFSIQKETQKIKFQITCNPDVEVFVNEFQICLVLENIISNAIKSTKTRKKPRIDLSCREYNNKTQLCVKDNGVGIDPAHHKKIFEIFSQIRTSEHDQDGTGIGLALAKKIVEGHNGKIWVVSETNSGAAFNIELPA